MAVTAAAVMAEERIETEVTLHGITDKLKPEHAVEYAEALQTAAAAFREAEELFEDDSYIERRGWKNDAKTDDGDIVYTKHVPKGKMATVSTTLEGNVDAVMKETWTGIGGLAEWNPNINYASTVQTLTDYADVVTYGNNDILVVTGRDFVSARIYRPLPTGGYIMVSRSVNVTSAPPKKDKVRAQLHLAAARFRPDPAAPKTKTLCEVVMLCDLKGLLPSLVVNQAIPKIMVMDTNENKKHFKKLAAEAAAAAGKQ